ncbi:coilin [Drosophila miranda]|uniref:coilin n=1 Tax=Drosophila miranda TaxID=7229 RepID=UPI00143F3CBD|nr:coilin [Drosophila miranda]
MEGFTMKVNLTFFFSDERQHALILIDSTWQTIEDVQNHIQVLFNLKDIRLLTNSGYFLPPKESLRVLKDASGLKAFSFHEPPATSLEEGSKETSKKRKKSFDETESLRCSPPWDQPKRSKQKNKSTLQPISLNAAADDKVNPSCNTSESDGPLSNSTLKQPKRFKQKNKSTSQSINLSAAADDKVNPSCNTSESDGPLSNSTLNQPKRFKQKNKSTSQSINLSAAADDKVNPSCNTSEAEEPLSNASLNQPKRFKQKKQSTLQPISLSAAADDKVNPSCNTSEDVEPLSNASLNQPKRFKQKEQSTLQPISLSAAADDKVNPSCNTSEDVEPLSNASLNQPKRFKQKKQLTLQPISLSAAADDKVNPSCNTSEDVEPLSTASLNQPKRFKQKKQSTLQPISLSAAADDKVNPSCNTNEDVEPLSTASLNQPKRFKQKKQSTLQPITQNAAADNKVNPSCNTSEDLEPLSTASWNQRKRSNKSTLQSISLNAAANDKAETLQTSKNTKECDQSSSDDDDNRKAEVIRVEPPVHNSFVAEHQISSSSLQITSTLPRSSELQEPDLTAKENSSTLLVPEPRPISFRCPLMELDSNKVRTYNISIKSKPALDIPRKSQKKQTDSSEHIKLATPKTAKHESTTIARAGATTEDVAPLVDVKTVPRRACADAIDCDSEDDVMVLDDTSVDVDSDVEVSPQVVPSDDSQANDSSMVMFKNASPLKDLPIRGDTILFKLRKIKNSMESGLTGVIAASCTYINRRTKAVSLQVISSPPGISSVLKQYCNSLDDSGEDIPCLMVNMTDLIEAKRVVPRA